jgi:hypothetical protein
MSFTFSKLSTNMQNRDWRDRYSFHSNVLMLQKQQVLTQGIVLPAVDRDLYRCYLSYIAGVRRSGVFFWSGYYEESSGNNAPWHTDREVTYGEHRVATRSYRGILGIHG